MEARTFEKRMILSTCFSPSLTGDNERWREGVGCCIMRRLDPLDTTFGSRFSWLREGELLFDADAETIVRLLSNCPDNKPLNGSSGAEGSNIALATLAYTRVQRQPRGGDQTCGTIKTRKAALRVKLVSQPHACQCRFKSANNMPPR